MQTPRPDNDLNITLSPDAPEGLAALPAPFGAVNIVVGPEGGLSTSELENLRDNGFVAVRLGPRVLRTETAAVAALTAAQLLWGDMR